MQDTARIWTGKAAMRAADVSAYGWCGRRRPTGGPHSPQRTKARHGSATVPNFPVDSSNAERISMRQQGRGRYSCRGMQGAFMNGVAILFAAAVFATVLFAIIATVAAPTEVRDEDGWR
jgi:hypothetical protein